MKVRDSFLELYGEFVTPRGTVVVVREETRSPSDNEKLAIKQLQTMLDKAEELSLVDRTKVEYVTEQERIKSNKTDAQIARYKERTLRDKKLHSQVKRNRSRDWE